MATTIALRSVALALARAGCHVHPLEPGGKAPATSNGFKDATRNPNKIRAWWDKSPTMNVGIATGASGLVVIDADHGKRWNPDWGQQPAACVDGADILISLAEQHPGGVEDFVGRWACSVATPSGGMHFYFSPTIDRKEKRTIFKSGVGVLPWVDVRAHGGYVVAPFSVTRAGAYRPGPGWTSTFATDTDSEIRPVGPVDVSIRMSYPQVPGWLAALLPIKDDRPAQSVDALEQVRRLLDAPTIGTGYVAKAIGNELQIVSTASEGSRNQTLHHAAIRLGTLVGSGHADEGAVGAALLQAAGSCGLDHGEATATIRSGLRYGMANPRQVSGL